MVSPTVTYLFDPLCGWCYGASPVIQALAARSDITLELAPTGLFSGGGRVLDAAFAEFAWLNDMRIAKLTGLRFTEAYRQQVLGGHGSPFDSTAATLALSAVKRVEPLRELQALVALQEARYVQGLNTCDLTVVAQVLRDMGLAEAADLLLAPDDDLKALNALRVVQAQTLKRRFGAQGVPAITVTDAKGSRMLNSNLLFGPVDNLLWQISAG